MSFELFKAKQSRRCVVHLKKFILLSNRTKNCADPWLQENMLPLLLNQFSM